MYYIKAVLIFFILLVNISLGDDNLYLNGIVKKINENTVLIDVKSESCRGIKEFKINKTKKIKVGKEIFFSINSSICDKGKIYEIVEVD